MAKLSANGKIVGEIENLIAVNRYMSNGWVLRNQGFGWKRARQIPADSTPEQEFAYRQEKARAFREARPAYTAYKTRLHNLAPRNKRLALHECVAMIMTASGRRCAIGPANTGSMPMSMISRSFARRTSCTSRKMNA